MNDFLQDLVRRSWNCDSYEERPFPVERMVELLEMLRWTASAANVQPWECFLVQDRELARSLGACLLDPFLRPATGQGGLGRAPLVVVVAIDRKRAAARYGEIGEHLLAVQDTAVAIAHLRLAAAEQGLGSAWIREVDLARVAEVLECPPWLRAVALLTFGFPKSLPQSVQGMPVSDWTRVLGT